MAKKKALSFEDSIRSKLKYMTVDEYLRLSSLDENQLLKEMRKALKAQKIEKNRKRDDETLTELKAIIKKHKENHDLKKEIEDLKAQIKDLKQTMEEEIEETILNKKDLEGGYNDSIKSFKEVEKVVNIILDTRVKTE